MVIGFGDLARRLAPKLTGLAEVIGVSRRPELLPETLASTVYGDYTNLDSLAEAASLKPDVVIFTPVPSSRDLEGYRLGYAQAARNICEAGVLTYAERAIFVSSTRVSPRRQVAGSPKMHRWPAAIPTSMPCSMARLASAVTQPQRYCAPVGFTMVQGPSCSSPSSRV